MAPRSADEPLPPQPQLKQARAEGVKMRALKAIVAAARGLTTHR